MYLDAFQIFSLRLNDARKTEEEQQDGAFEDHVANTAWEIFDSGLDVVIADLAGQNTAIQMANRPRGEQAKTARNAAWKITAHMLGLSNDEGRPSIETMISASVASVRGRDHSHVGSANEPAAQSREI